MKHSKETVSKMKRTIILVALTFLMTGGISSAWADPGDNPVIPPDQKPFGKSYGEWAGGFWQWFLSIPGSVHPFLDESGENCALGQGGKVWYLVGDPTFGVGVTRSCTVPIGKVILFPIINADCSTLEPPPFFGKNKGQLRKCVRDIGFSNADILSVTIDGKTFDTDDLLRFRLNPSRSPVFGIVIPDENNVGVDTTVKGNVGKAVAGGYYVMIAPLSPGDHTIQFEGELGAGPFAGFTQIVTYNLTVAD